MGLDMILFRAKGVWTQEELSTSEILESGTFEETQGFFWGFSDIGKWKDTLEILTKALIKTDFSQESILYCSWW